MENYHSNYNKKQKGTTSSFNNAPNTLIICNKNKYILSYEAGSN